MVITTSSPDVLAARRLALDLLLSNHYGDCKAPCTLTCPSNVDIQGYLGLVANGRDAEAVQLIRRDNPMPAVIGRICPRPCEDRCRRALVDEPLNVNGIKRFVADVEAQAGGFTRRALPPRRGKKAAVVGAGPAGLSAAWYLSEKGVDVTVFESMEKAGGMLRYGIPDYRLPPAVLDKAIEEMLSLGVVLRTGQRLGRDITLESLRGSFDAVVLALGAWKGRPLRIPGEDNPHVLSGIDFLRDVNAGLTVHVGDRVAVLGGGNTALDAARCSLRMGASHVTMYYRRTREEMPASGAEIDEALEEGIDIRYLAAPVSVQEQAGALSLTLLKMTLGDADASGRRRPVPVEGSEYSVPVDTVITAVGQYSDVSALSAGAAAGNGALVDERGNLKADVETGMTPVPGVFAAGDLLTGTDIAIRAIAGGKHAARAALAYLGSTEHGGRDSRGETGRAAAGQGHPYERPVEFLSRKADLREPVAADYAEVPRAPRARPAVRAAASRKTSFVEIESTLSPAAARSEAERCLECGCQDVEDCALKVHATDYDASAKRFLGEVAAHPIDDSHPFISRDPSKCILCGRCIRICLDVQGIGVFGYIYRGFATVVAPSFGVPLGEDRTCISCGQCVSACPVGALTEKSPAHKTTPLPERVEQGTCSQCSFGCGIEYRWHGAHFLRATERFDAPGHGKLCRKGRFGFDFLNDPLPRATVDPAETAHAVQKMIAAARYPLMRISPVLCGEAIDAFVEAAGRLRVPFIAEGLETLDPRWAALLSDPPVKPGALPRLILVGDIEATSNVAFTEAWRRRREGAASALWIAGHDSEPARRVADRIFPTADEALAEAAAAGGDIEVWVNPQETPASALDSLLSMRGRVHFMLLWNARNTGYIFARQDERRAVMPRKADLLLDIGTSSGLPGVKRIAWSHAADGRDLSIPLPRSLWIHGRSHPTGLPGTTSGSIDREGLNAAAAVLG
jgi:formate dehydrogenase major subunit